MLANTIVSLALKTGKYVSLSMFRRLPVVNKTVVFNNFNGRGFGDNPKYIAAELADSDLKLVWLSSKETMRSEFPPYVVPVRMDRPRGWYHLCTARILVSNVRNLPDYRKRKGQFYLQTWHGVMWFKRVEKDAEPLLGREYVERAKLDGKMCDLFIANNASDEELFHTSFWYDGPVMRCGTPRLAPVVRRDPAQRERVLKALGVPTHCKTVLFAPTFRDQNTSYVPPLDTTRLIDALQDTFCGEFVCLLRLHPNVPAGSFPLTEWVVDASSIGDIQEVLAVADVLVTDYSSICFDYVMGVPRPVYMFIPDMDDYLSSARKPYHDLSECPLDELCEAVRSTNLEELQRRYRGFLAEYGFEDDGNGAQDVAALLVDVCEGREDIDQLSVSYKEKRER